MGWLALSTPQSSPLGKWACHFVWQILSLTMLQMVMFLHIVLHLLWRWNASASVMCVRYAKKNADDILQLQSVTTNHSHILTRGRDFDEEVKRNKEKKKKKKPVSLLVPLSNSNNHQSGGKKWERKTTTNCYELETVNHCSLVTLKKWSKKLIPSFRCGGTFFDAEKAGPPHCPASVCSVSVSTFHKRIWLVGRRAVFTALSVKLTMHTTLFMTIWLRRLAHGCISPRQIYWEIKHYERERTGNQSTYWVIFELLWRDYFRFVALKYGNQLFVLGGEQFHLSSVVIKKFKKNSFWICQNDFFIKKKKKWCVSM